MDTIQEIENRWISIKNSNVKEGSHYPEKESGLNLSRDLSQYALPDALPQTRESFVSKRPLPRQDLFVRNNEDKHGMTSFDENKEPKGMPFHQRR